MTAKPTTERDKPTKSQPEHSPEPDQLSPKHATVDANANARQGVRLPGYVYGSALKPASAGPPDAEHYAFVADAIQRMAPRDPAEEMLVAELAAVHGRVLRLNILANGTNDLNELRIINELADKASNTYRRLMLALKEYRRPPRSGDTIAVVGQANIAQQQVVQNHEQQENATNEQGFVEPRLQKKELPADSGGLGSPASVCRTRETMGAIRRAADA